jgi:hypothetical protein
MGVEYLFLIYLDFSNFPVVTSPSVFGAISNIVIVVTSLESLHLSVSDF